MESFATIVNGINIPTIGAKFSILDVCGHVGYVFVPVKCLIKMKC